MNIHGMHGAVTGGNLRPSFRAPRVPTSVPAGRLSPRFTAGTGLPGVSA